MVKDSYRKVASNHGSYGIDKVSLGQYQSDLLNNLYVLWNRLSSGSYFPKAVRSVSIPKGNGKQRLLGIPTVNDRIAQQVVKTYLEPRLETEFLPHSYGYRPRKGAHGAVAAVKTNVRKYPWVLDMDIKNFFDDVDHDLLLKAVNVHVPEKWVKLYLNRWLTSARQQADGSLIENKGKGTPQGGVISPLLANLFLHYVLDKWLVKFFPQVTFVRYADDVIVHCPTEAMVKQAYDAIRNRLQECKLSLNQEKTKIVYCRDYKRPANGYGKKFDFLGFTFKPDYVANKLVANGRKRFLSFNCFISQSSQKKIVEGWKKPGWHLRSELTIQEIAIRVNPRMRGIIQYYGKVCMNKVPVIIRRFEFYLAKWVLNKYGRFRDSYRKAYRWISELRQSYPGMFYHWTLFA
jgi:group II intron reverse transcriptase/maturase